MYKRGVLILIFLLLLPSVLAANGEIYHLKLLAVQEEGSNLEGSDADLFLELKEGSGRVFLETFPLTKIDTQISTRFAKDVACKNFKLNCNKHDFIFTIKAKSNIIGGPSAGAAMSALTAIAVLDLPYDNKIAVTGTINSGGIIGHVGGVKEKVEAAKKADLKKVLIAKGNGFRGNDSVDVVTYAKENLSLAVDEVLDLDDVILKLTGKDLNHKPANLTENQEYTRIMKSLQNVLCKRTQEIETTLLEEGYQLDQDTTIGIIQRKGLADNATRDLDFYSAASFCFGLNTQLRTLLLEHRSLNRGSITKDFDNLERKIKALEEKLQKEKIETITDLQTMMVVKERINDVKDQIKKSREDSLERDELYRLLAYAEERFFSAISWMQFFVMDGKKFVMDEDRLIHSCELKISESEERHQYASLFITPSGTIEKIQTAKKALENGEYLLCLITASQAKAESAAILSTLGLREENVDELLEAKRKVTARVIAENSAEGMFPILGYSYYQYANTLKDREKYSALLYLEYALEMSEISIYFPEEKEFFERIELDLKIDDKWLYLIVGFAAGSFITLYLLVKNPNWLGRKKRKTSKMSK